MISDQPRAIDRVLSWSGTVRLVLSVAVLLLPLMLAINLFLEPQRQAIRAAREVLMIRQQEVASGQIREAGYRQLKRQAAVRDRLKARFETWLPLGEQIPEALAIAALAARAAGAVDLTFDREGADKDVVPSTEISATKDVATASPIEIPVRMETRVTLRAAGLFTDALLISPRHSRLEELRIVSLPPERLAKLPVGDSSRLSMLIRVTLFSRMPEKS